MVEMDSKALYICEKERDFCTGWNGKVNNFFCDTKIQLD